jgi:pimeloyl-ACP methyl ester carboxylesterase
VPSGFTATVEEYRRWLITELERFEQPVHLVGHDWGGAHVVNVAMTRADLLHSWVCDVIGLFDQDYRWHDLGQVWATPGAGEDAIAAMINPPVTERAAAMVKKGMHEDVALGVAKGQNAAMGRPWPCSAATSSEPRHDRACQPWPARTTSPAPTSSAVAPAPAPAPRSQSSKDWATGGSPKTHSGAPRPSTASGQEWDTIKTA